ncbi:hypothetical protein DDQ68_07555 [Hymenobacter nivis]|uniref:Uncharacterized protein n=1 Tax=Hymenobacter nivis TaxID=1850093 RepID=A0A2Z3GGE6_9BACT|nr:hypothetical protein DDQ68_07555 [Hymenobacter nivis]
MGPGTVLFTGRLLAIARGFFKEVFPDVVRVTRIGVAHTALGQVRGQAPHADLVDFTARVDAKIERDAVGGGYDLHLKAIEPAPLAGALSIIRLVL